MTLIEVAIASALMVVIFGAGLTLSVESGDTWNHIYNDSSALQATRDALRLIATELATSHPDQVLIDTGSEYDTLVFRVPVALEEDDIVWGAGGTEGHSIRIAVQEGRLVRQVLNADEYPVGPSRLLVRSVDSLHDGRKGFAVSRDDGLCTISLRAVARQDGHTWRRQVTTGVLLRNRRQVRPGVLIEN